MDDRPATPSYHGGQGSSASCLGWLLVLTMIFVGTVLCLSLSYGIAAVCGG